MKRIVFLVLTVVAFLGLSAIAFAAEGTPAKPSLSDPSILSAIMWSAAIGMGLAAFGCAIGQGMGLRAALEGAARNPEAAAKIQTMLILGLAFIESLGIYALVVNLLLLFANPYVLPAVQAVPAG